jgi:phosphopantothenoylcysteine decarboxylase/phosphopantothenate--cysteine ligase
VAQSSEQKIKKHDEEMLLRLVRNPDILATVARRPQRPFMVGFAAETENLLTNASSKVRRKKLDLIFANDASATFNSDEASAVALWPMSGEDKLAQQSLGPAAKSVLARQMLTLLSERLLQHKADT